MSITIPGRPGNNVAPVYVATWREGDTRQTILEKIQEQAKKIQEQKEKKDVPPPPKPQTASSRKWRCNQCKREFRRRENAFRHFWCLKDAINSEGKSLLSDAVQNYSDKFNRMVVKEKGKGN